jgi:pyruvate/2-oxoglutarate dehydrogenase complex dihydrolipoamide dehydrogenase (E3) component
VGCIPTKALVRSAEAIHTARRGAEFGFRAEVEVDFQRVVARKDELVSLVRGGLERSLEQNPHIELIRGWARFERPGRIVVDTRELESERVILASGVEPHIPAIPGLDEVPHLTNETVMDLQELPKRLIVLGGGAEAQLVAGVGVPEPVFRLRQAGRSSRRRERSSATTPPT